MADQTQTAVLIEGVGFARVLDRYSTDSGSGEYLVEDGAGTLHAVSTWRAGWVDPTAGKTMQEIDRTWPKATHEDSLGTISTVPYDSLVSTTGGAPESDETLIDEIACWALIRFDDGVRPRDTVIEVLGHASLLEEHDATDLIIDEVLL